MARIASQVSNLVGQRYDVDRASNTFKQTPKDNPKDRIEVEIGDSKQPDFKPQAKISRWNNEVNFSLRAEEHPEATVRTSGKQIEYITPEYEVHMYDLDPGEIGEDGGLEFEWVLPQKPSTNVLTATIQTKELDFFYQPELTPEEIEEGAERSESVVGSYAVYHKTKGGMNRADGMEYKVGKAFHIYRPKVTDAEGNSTWAELHIDEVQGLMTISIDPKWLDEAMYPIVVDPTFGYTSVGATAFGPIWVRYYQAIAPESGTLDSISMYGRHDFMGTNVSTIVAIYSDSSDAPNSRLQTGSGTMEYGNDASWESASMGSYSFSAAKYHLAFENSSGPFRAFYDTGGVSNTDSSFTLPSIASPQNTDTDRHYSIYATYTEAEEENDSPTVTLNSPADQATVSPTPKFEFTGTDPEDDDITYQIQIATEDTFADPIIDAVSDTDEGFANEDTPADEDPFNSGDKVSYQVGEPE